MKIIWKTISLIALFSIIFLVSIKAGAQTEISGESGTNGTVNTPLTTNTTLQNNIIDPYLSGPAEKEKIFVRQSALLTEVENLAKQIDQRNGFFKFIIGPDYRKLIDLNIKLQDLQAGIEEARNIRQYLTNEAEHLSWENQIWYWIEKQDAVEKKYQANSKTFSLLGWAFKLSIK